MASSTPIREYNGYERNGEEKSCELLNIRADERKRLPQRVISPVTAAGPPHSLTRKSGRNIDIEAEVRYSGGQRDKSPLSGIAFLSRVGGDRSELRSHSVVRIR